MWTSASGGLLGSISDLNEAVKVNKKDVFVNATKVVIKAIQVLFKATGTYETNSQHLTKSKALATHHKEVTDNLSKLVLASKLASGVWPPPDATTRVQQIMLDIVKVLKSFMTIAIDQAVPIEASCSMPERTFQPPKAKKKVPLPKPSVASKPAPPSQASKPTLVPMQEPVPPPQSSKPTLAPVQPVVTAASSAAPIVQSQPEPEPEPEAEDDATEPEVSP